MLNRTLRLGLKSEDGPIVHLASSGPFHASISERDATIIS
jgi:hypothetical protein